MKRIMFVVVVFASLLLSACGGAAPSDTIDVTLTDFQYIPNSFTVPAGKEITVNAQNSGAVVHNFVVMKLGADAGTEFDDEDTPNIYWRCNWNLALPQRLLLPLQLMPANIKLFVQRQDIS